MQFIDDRLGRAAPRKRRALRQAADAEDASQERARIAPFLSKLVRLLSTCSSDVGCWSDDGSSFCINDELAPATVIPQFFSHTNFRSFCRQLSCYGFKKTRKRKLSNADGQGGWSEFAHDLFVRGRPELLAQIRRMEHLSEGAASLLAASAAHHAAAQMLRCSRRAASVDESDASALEMMDEAPMDNDEDEDEAPYRSSRESRGRESRPAPALGGSEADVARALSLCAAAVFQKPRTPTGAPAAEQACSSSSMGPAIPRGLDVLRFAALACAPAPVSTPRPASTPNVKTGEPCPVTAARAVARAVSFTPSAAPRAVSFTPGAAPAPRASEDDRSEVATLKRRVAELEVALETTKRAFAVLAAAPSNVTPRGEAPPAPPAAKRARPNLSLSPGFAPGFQSPVFLANDFAPPELRRMCVFALQTETSSKHSRRKLTAPRL